MFEFNFGLPVETEGQKYNDHQDEQKTSNKDYTKGNDLLAFKFFGGYFVFFVEQFNLNLVIF